MGQQVSGSWRFLLDFVGFWLRVHLVLSDVVFMYEHVVVVVVKKLKSSATQR